MVKDQLSKIIGFLVSGISDLTDTLEETTSALNAFQKSLLKAKKDVAKVKEVKTKKGVSGKRSASSGRARKPASKQAANVLFDMLSDGEKAPSGDLVKAKSIGGAKKPRPKRPSGVSAAPKRPSGPPKSGPPKSGPPKSGPPSGPPGGGPPKKPSAPSRLPAPPKLPPGGGPPSGPPGGGPPSGPPGGGPKRPSAPPSGPPRVSSSSGGGAGLGGLRDEMLGELERLKKIMRGG